MSISVEQSVPIVRSYSNYMLGIVASLNSTTPNTKIDVTAGVCGDQFNVFDINLGSYDATALSGDVTTIDATQVGLNGLDQGALAASTVYKIYVVADPVSANPTGCVLSTASIPYGPVMPFGYSIYRLAGYAVTDSSSHFLPMNIVCGPSSAGDQQNRAFFYQAPQATNITAGASTSYADVTTSAVLPSAANIVAVVNAAFTPAAASDTANIIGRGNTGDFSLITGQVASVVVPQQLLIPTPLGTATKLQYKVSAGALNIKIAGFYFNV